MLHVAELAASHAQELTLSAPDAPRAVFVDPSGRRHRLVARTCWILGGIGIAYVALVVLSLLLPPGLARLAVPGLGDVLPGPGAAPLGAAQTTGEVRAPDVLLAPSPSGSAAPRRADVSPRPAAPVASPAATGRPTPLATSPAPAPQSSPAPASPSPSPPGAAPATPPGQQPSAEPTRASAAPATPPGQNPSRSPRPRPSSTRGPR